MSDIVERLRISGQVKLVKEFSEPEYDSAPFGLCYEAAASSRGPC